MRDELFATDLADKDAFNHFVDRHVGGVFERLPARLVEQHVNGESLRVWQDFVALVTAHRIVVGLDGCRLALCHVIFKLLLRCYFRELTVSAEKLLEHS